MTLCYTPEEEKALAKQKLEILARSIIDLTIEKRDMFFARWEKRHGKESLEKLKEVAREQWKLRKQNQRQGLQKAKAACQ